MYNDRVYTFSSHAHVSKSMQFGAYPAHRCRLVHIPIDMLCTFDHLLQHEVPHVTLLLHMHGTRWYNPYVVYPALACDEVMINEQDSKH